ncbi:MAG: Trk system potassium transporter TrkA [Deltaproteobacteria bacterium]|nr:Trk system potassium transporter TrkA [Deltaproteobacteria bacterium]
MRVVIAGVGEVGYHVVETLFREGVELTALDTQENLLENLEREFHLTTFLGSATDALLLEKARVGEADLFLAVTNHDETNVIACMMAAEMGAKRKIARIKSIDLGMETAMADSPNLGIDLIINPFEVAAEHLTSMVKHPQVTDYNRFLSDRVLLVRFRLEAGCPLVNEKVSTFGQVSGIPQTLMALVQRGGVSQIPHGEYVLQAGDQVYFFCERHQLKRLSHYLGFHTKPGQRIFINGGGNIGYALARRLEKEFEDVRVLEISAARCQYLSQVLDRALVLNMDGTDADLLALEGIGDVDYFISTTQREDVNMVSAMMAHRLGVKKTIALVAQPEFLPIVQENPMISAAFCPRLLTARKLMLYVQGLNLLSFFAFPNSDIEVLELQVPAGCQALKGTISTFPLPTGVLVGAVARGERIFIPRGNDELLEGDRILVIQHRNNRAATKEFFMEESA